MLRQQTNWAIARAPVRLAGLYALERLGQDNARLRQTVIDVICAYLRMPYAPPISVLARVDLNQIADDVPRPRQTQSKREQELNIRNAAQKILREHTKLPPNTQRRDEPDTYWRSPQGARMNLDVSGATLVGLDLIGCHIGDFFLGGAHILGNAYLQLVEIHGGASLSGVEFHGTVKLVGARFHSWTIFKESTFYDDVQMNGAMFYGLADFDESEFLKSADLTNAQFRGAATMRTARFRRTPRLEGTLVKPASSSPPTFPTEGWNISLPPGWHLGTEADHGLYHVISDIQDDDDTE
jgi:hypothetical protein